MLKRKFKPPHYIIQTTKYTKLRDRDKVMVWGRGEDYSVGDEVLNTALVLDKSTYTPLDRKLSYIINDDPLIKNIKTKVTDLSGKDYGPVDELNISKLKQDKKYTIDTSIKYTYNEETSIIYEYKLPKLNFYTVRLPKKPVFREALKVGRKPSITDKKSPKLKRVTHFNINNNGDIKVKMGNKYFVKDEDYIVVNNSIVLRNEDELLDKVVKISYIDDKNYSYRYRTHNCDTVNLKNSNKVIHLPDETVKVYAVFDSTGKVDSKLYTIKDNEIYFNNSVKDDEFVIEYLLKTLKEADLGTFNTLEPTLSWYQQNTVNFKSILEYTLYEDHDYTESTEVDSMGKSYAKLSNLTANEKYRARVKFVKTVDYEDGTSENFSSVSEEIIFNTNNIIFEL